MNTTDQGLYISFLGVDGIGKSTLAAHLADDLRRSGRTVRAISWDSALDAELPVWPQEALRTMYIETYRLLFGGAKHRGEHVALPERYADWRKSDAQNSLAEMEVSASAPSGLLAALLVEFAGNVVLHAEVIRPAVDRGEVVIQETYPYKHVLKEYLVTAEASRRSDAPSYSAAEVDALFAMVERFFANELRPDLGLLMDGPVELAYRWRMRQSGRTGILEDFRIAGTPGHEGFIRLQSESAHHYRRFARDWGWQLHTVQDDPVEENLARGLGLVRSEIRRLRPGWNLS